MESRMVEKKAEWMVHEKVVHLDYVLVEMMVDK